MAGLTKEQRAQRAAEKAAKEAADREAAEKAAKEAADREAAEKAEAERQQAEEAAREAGVVDVEITLQSAGNQAGEALPPTLSEYTGETPNLTRIEDTPTVETVRMVRDEPMHLGGPTGADVHPDEVENWSAAGWRVE